jgi:hypothetical protein
VASDAAASLPRRAPGSDAEGKYDLAKDQLATIEKLCGSKDCEYYEDLADALEKAHAL